MHRCGTYKISQYTFDSPVTGGRLCEQMLLNTGTEYFPHPRANREVTVSLSTVGMKPNSGDITNYTGHVSC